MSTECSVKMPKSSRSSSGRRSTPEKAGAAGERLASGASGTRPQATTMAAIARPPVIAKMPWMPTHCAREGAATNDTAKAAPIVEPMIAIALLRWVSRVRSAAKAIATPEIAPTPCSTRPAIIPPGVALDAHTKLPAAMAASPT